MRMCVALVAVVFAAAPAAAEPTERPSLERYVRCPGVVQTTALLRPRALDPLVRAGGDQVVSSPEDPTGAGSSGGGLWLGDLKEPQALLLAAVITAALLPLVVYGVDLEADEDIAACWTAPTQWFELLGGALTGAAPGEWGGLAGVRAQFASGVLGFSVAAESSREALGYRAVDANLLLRLPPKQHIELALAVGYRHLELGTGFRDGLELALPHRYLPFREGVFEPGVSFEVRPAALLHRGGIDLRLDGYLALPVGEVGALQLGARAFSLDSHVHLAGLLALTAGL